LLQNVNNIALRILEKPPVRRVCPFIGEELTFASALFKLILT